MMNRAHHSRSLISSLLTAALLFPFLLLSGVAQSGPNGATSREASSAPRNLTELQSRIASLLDQPQFKGARWGVLIKTSSGLVLFDRDSGRSFMPASNMKLYTTAAALDSFGPDSRIRTSVWATRPIRNGVVGGDLILYGRGDPNLSPRFSDPTPKKYNEMTSTKTVPAIEALADQIKARGVRLVTGRLVGDDSYFAGDLLGPGWEWDDAQFYYGAEISALSVNDNSITISVTPGRRAGSPAVVRLLPETSYVQIVNHTKTTGGGQTRIGIERPLGRNTVEIFGSIVLGAPESNHDIAVHDPASYAATLLREALARRKIRVNGAVKRVDATLRSAEPLDQSKLTEVARLDSEPLSEILKVVNKQSQNLHAELLLRQLGKSTIALPNDSTLTGVDDYGRPRPILTRANLVRTGFLERAGVELKGLSLRDGSGLARQNMVTPAATVRLLEFMSTHQYQRSFLDSLGVAGTDGTLERRFRETLASNNLRGKTGTLTFANALSGYLTTKGGQQLILSLMGNNFVGPGREVTGVIDQICILLAEYDGSIE